jgi:F0F1-type ATP synthase membrane subunit b/b'
MSVARDDRNEMHGQQNVKFYILSLLLFILIYLIFVWPSIISIYDKENNQIDATIDSLLKFQS